MSQWLQTRWRLFMLKKTVLDQEKKMFAKEIKTRMFSITILTAILLIVFAENAKPQSTKQIQKEYKHKCDTDYSAPDSVAKFKQFRKIEDLNTQLTRSSFDYIVQGRRTLDLLSNRQDLFLHGFEKRCELAMDLTDIWHAYVFVDTEGQITDVVFSLYFTGHNFARRELSFDTKYFLNNEDLKTALLSMAKLGSSWSHVLEVMEKVDRGDFNEFSEGDFVIAQYRIPVLPEGMVARLGVPDVSTIKWIFDPTKKLVDIIVR